MRAKHYLCFDNSRIQGDLPVKLILPPNPTHTHHVASAAVRSNALVLFLLSWLLYLFCVLTAMGCH